MKVNKKLGTKSRPDVVPWWIKHARPMHKIPPNLDLAIFPNEVRLWWTSIQPEWRIQDGSGWSLGRDVPQDED